MYSVAVFGPEIDFKRNVNKSNVFCLKSSDLLLTWIMYLNIVMSIETTIKQAFTEVSHSTAMVN